MSDQFTIKPLVWEGRRDYLVAVTIIGEFFTQEQYDGTATWWADGSYLRKVASLAAAKLAAEAHYRERLMQALEPVEEK